ncbi:MAG: 50S ribosomal protein L6 [Acidobacteriota bacterium]
MSRIGRLPVKIPDGVTVTVEKSRIHVKGPKGDLTTLRPDGIDCKVDKGQAVLTRGSDARRQRALHGLTRALLANAVAGVTSGWKQQLEIQGIGYRAAVKGKQVEFALGFSHPVIYSIPDGVTIEVQRNTQIAISGVDRQRVGQAAAEIRALKPPEPYKGKGIRYAGEVVRKKVGKTGA